MAANNFLSPPSKRPLMSDSSNSLSSNTTTTKRAKPQPPPLPIPAGHASLRMLCHASLISSFIGKSGSSIKTLQLNTGSKIRVEDSLQLGSDDRVIVIVAPNIRIKKMSSLHGNVEFEMEVSAVQEAAVRVFERVMEISGEVTTAFCRLLVEENQAGSVIGKGGKTVEKLRRESGAKIRVLLGDKLPPGVSSPHEVVEIEGDVLAVEKALLGVCGQLQECRQADKSSIKDNESRPSELNSKSSVNEFRADPPRHQMPSSVVNTSYSPALVGRPSSFEPDRLRIRSNSQSSVYDFHADPPLHQTPLSVATTSYSPAMVGMPSSFEPDRLHTQSNSQSSVYDFRANPPLHQMPLSVATTSYSPALVGRTSSFEPDRPSTQSNSQSSVYGFLADPPLHQMPLSVATTSYSPALVGRPSLFEPDWPSTQSNSQSSVYGFRADPPLHQTPLSVATTSSGPALVGRSSLFEPDRLQNPDIKLQQQEVVFKILCSNDRVGGVIGRGGSIIKALQEESGASINVGSSVADCDERLITISSKEDVDSRNPPAQRAVVLVYSRSVEAGADRGLETGLNKGSSVSARLVVPSNQAGCLLGKGGVIISEMRKATGASIHILKGDHLPKCVAQDDEVVEISGQFVNIQDALYHVTSRLRNNLFTSKTTNTSGSGNGKLISDTTIHGSVRDMTPSSLHHSSMTSMSINGQATLRQGLDPSLRPHVSEHSPSVGLRTSETAGVNPRSFVNLGRGLASANGGLDLGRPQRPAFVTNTKVEISVPESAISSVYGENGRNLTRIRQISGAQVIVHEALPGATHRTVVISGTPDETQAAQSLLHAFILTGSS